MAIESLIQKLELQPHPEGGYYKETYRSEETLIGTGGQTRNICTAIYYLLEDNDRSAFHSIRSNELWFFHEGTALEILYIEKGALNRIVLGGSMPDAVLQACIPANTWFGARVLEGKGYALVSCVVAPGFDFADFELASRNDLLLRYPDLSEIIM